MVVAQRTDKIIEQFRSADLKLTSQRKAILDVLYMNEGNHLSAEDVYILLKNKLPEVGLATIYRTLELLYELRMANKLNFGDNIARYELISMEREHHHLICVQCGKVEEIDYDLIRPIKGKIRSSYDFQLTDQCLVFQGICAMCREEDRKQALFPLKGDMEATMVRI